MPERLFDDPDFRYFNEAECKYCGAKMHAIDADVHRLECQQKPPGRGLCFGVMLWASIERDIAIQAGVSRAVHFPHPARADQTDDLIRTQLVAHRQRHTQ